MLVISLISISLLFFVNAQEGSGGGGGGGVTNESDASVEYDPEILDAFEKQTWLHVTVRLKDMSGILVTGTTEERRGASKQIYEWFDPVIDEVLATLSETEFNLRSRRSAGFGGNITKQGFNKLINDIRVRKVFLSLMEPGSGLENDSIITEGGTDETIIESEVVAESENETVTEEDKTSEAELQEVGIEKRNLLWLWILFVVIALIIIFYLIIKIRKR